MSQVEIQILKQGTISRNVISACFFTMADAYRPVEKYISSLKSYIDMATKTGFEVRIYTDDSGKDIVLQHSSHSSVSVYHYNYTPMREKVGHIGTFGTLMRFLPMFEDLDTVWISDIDVPDLHLPSFDTPVFYNEMVCYERKIYGRKHTIVADKMIFKVTFPIGMLTRFINKLSTLEEIRLLNSANKHKPASKIPYGIDELFLNTSIYDYLKRHEISVTVSKSYLLNSGFYSKAGLTQAEKGFANNYYRNPIKRDFKKLKDLYKEKVYPLVEEYPCLAEIFEEIDNLSYTMEKVSKLSYSAM